MRSSKRPVASEPETVDGPQKPMSPAPTRFPTRGVRLMPGLVGRGSAGVTVVVGLVGATDREQYASASATLRMKKRPDRLDSKPIRHPRACRLRTDERDSAGDSKLNCARAG